MEYLEATFRVTCTDSLLQTARDLLADAAAEAGFESFEDTENGLKGYVQKSLFNKEVLDQQIADFPLQDTKIDYTISEAEDKDWNKTWEDNGFEPIDIDGKILIVDANSRTTDPTPSPSPSGRGETYPMGTTAFHQGVAQTPLPEGEGLEVGSLRILIDAKLAFGTGTHETTQMIVSTLLSMAEANGGTLASKRVLDCGCGTGILGIAAAKLGAKEVVGYDIDEWSVRNTMHNAEINGVKNIKALLGDASVIKTIDGSFDILLANINRNILLNDMEAMRSKMTDGATFIISGFYEDDIPLLVDKAASLSLSLKDQKGKGNWRCLVFALPE